MDDVSWSNFFLRSLTLGLPAESSLGMFVGGRSLLMGADTERKFGRSGLRVVAAVGGGREAWLGIEEGIELPREVGAVVTIGALFPRPAEEFGSTPL